jgi:hypothetical protein
MVNRPLMKLSLALSLVLASAASASAQESPRDILASFPESQALLYVNARRIFDEALPRVIPQQKLDEMLGGVQKETSFDPRSIHFVAVGARYREPFSMTTPPDFVVMVKGTFNAEALLSFARMAVGEKMTQETYRGKTINLFRFPEKKQETGAPPTQPEQKKEAPFPYPELAIVALDPGTVIAGVPGYVRAALDAAEGGQGRVRADLVDLVARNPDNLVSFGGDMPASLLDFAKSMGAPPNPEIERVIASLKQVQFSVSMNASDFGAHTIVRTDTPESAQVINGFVTMGLSFGKMAVEEALKKAPAAKARERAQMQAALSLISSIRNVAAGNEVQVEAAVPQATIAEFVRQEMARQSQTKKSTRKPAVRRRGRARRR